MFRIIKFLSDFRNGILWIALQVLSFWLIVTFNDAQRHTMGDTILALSGSIQEKRAGLTSYFNLTKANEELQAENIELHQNITKLKNQLEFLKDELNPDSSKIAVFDTTKLQKFAFKYIPCRAINNSTDKNYNYITLDKGVSDGVKVGMGVISPKGVAGTIVRVSQDYSLALSMLNIRFKLSAKDLRTGNVGLYEWQGGDSRYGYLKDIPQDVEIRIGDTVASSGYSSVFPEGFVIGVIADNKSTQGGFYKAKVALSTDFTALKDLYILEALHRPQIDSLKQGIEQ